MDVRAHCAGWHHVWVHCVHSQALCDTKCIPTRKCCASQATSSVKRTKTEGFCFARCLIPGLSGARGFAFSVRLPQNLLGTTSRTYSHCCLPPYPLEITITLIANMFICAVWIICRAHLCTGCQHIAIVAVTVSLVCRARPVVSQF